MISVVIKDAQELGMHRDSLDPKPVDSTAEAALENEWLIQRRRKMFMVLALWSVLPTLRTTNLICNPFYPLCLKKHLR